jgi:prophage antirepressor-like protein
MEMNNQITTPPAKTGEDEKFIHFTACFQGKQVRILLNKISNEILFNADDVTKCLELGSTSEEFFSSDKGLDCIIEYKKENPDKPIFGEDGMFQKITI